MTIDEILQRHGLTRDDNVLMPDCDKSTPIEKYALIYEDVYADYGGWDLCVDILGYYPNPGLYLLKYKTSWPPQAAIRQREVAPGFGCILVR